MQEDAPSVKKITIESRVNDITKAKLRLLRESADLDLEIAFGFESANPSVRKLCINKNFSNQFVFEICKKMKDYEISPAALVMFKPPFLTESEAVLDMLNTFHFQNGTVADRIDIELPAIQKNTLMHSLWKTGHY